MILVRDIFQLKFGKAREALTIWDEGAEIMKQSGLKIDRVLTDLTGPYYTLVMETVHENLAAFESAMKAETAADQWASFYRKFVPLVESGRREIFKIVRP